jgi:hypothetical protein
MTQRVRRGTRATALAAVVLLCIGFVLPPEKIVRVMSQQRGKAKPLRVELELVRMDDSGTRLIRAEIHPDRGARFEDADGTRWLLRDGRVMAGPDASSQSIPDLDVLLLRGEGALNGWLAAKNISVETSYLARCGDADCLVIGEPDAHSQLWVDKDRFEVRRFVAGFDHVVDLEEWADFDGVRFPARTRVSDVNGPLAELHVRALAVAPELDQADFSGAWVRAGR